MKGRESDYKMESRLIHGRMWSEAWEYGHHLVPPISTSATFRLDSALRGATGFQEFAHEGRPDHHIYIYDRLREPNKDLLEESLAEAEQGEIAVTFSTGMAAIAAAVTSLTGAGKHLVAHHTLYGCTRSFLDNWCPHVGISVSEIDLTDMNELADAIRPETRLVYFETPANPTLEIIDIEAVSNVVEAYNRSRTTEEKIYVVVDNTFATPFCQRPLTLGADIVVHSLTKGIGGFGTDMGGVIIGPAHLRDRFLLHRKDFGAVLPGRSAWGVLVHGLPTLSIRMKKMQENAREVTEFLVQHPMTDQVMYPGLDRTPGAEIARSQMRSFDGSFAPGSMIYFELAGQDNEERHERGTSLINCLASEAYTISLAVSLGNVRTLIEHPSSMTHAAIPLDEQEAMGIHSGGVRISLGIEDPADIVRDLESGLAAVASDSKSVLQRT